VIAFVFGSAACLAADMEQALAVGQPDMIIAVNAASVAVMGPVPHLATMHPANADGWLDQRRRRGLPDPDRMWCPEGSPGGQGARWSHAPAWGGSSGLFAVSVAVAAGAERVVLCGVPLDAQPHFDDPRPWTAALLYRHAWTIRRSVLRVFVRSCSGWTRELLGPPTAEWLNGEGAGPERSRESTRRS
jgi:hypothetical protein